MTEERKYNTPSLLKASLSGTCPRCGEDSIFVKGVTLKEKCGSCGLKLEGHDVGDGVSVFLIFIFVFTLAPLFLMMRYFDWQLMMAVPFMVIITLIVTLLVLRPSYALILALIYKYRPDDYEIQKSEGQKSEV